MQKKNKTRNSSGISEKKSLFLYFCYLTLLKDFNRCFLIRRKVIKEISAPKRSGLPEAKAIDFLGKNIMVCRFRNCLDDSIHFNEHEPSLVNPELLVKIKKLQTV